MIAFKDFVPEQQTQPGFLTQATFEAFESAVERASAWIAEMQLTPINVETVVLPNIHLRHEEGSTDPELRAYGESNNYWHQIVRVWYRT